MAETRSLRVLVVGNEASTREMLARDLESLGHAVTQAEDGTSGVEAAKVEPVPELVILDLTMDLKGGDMVMEEIRADVRTAAVPAIFCSMPGYATVRRKLGERPRITLHKPFRLEQLKNAVAAAMADIP